MSAPSLDVHVALAQAEVRSHVATGLVPYDVPGFSTLHEYLDANVLGGLCDEGFADRFGEGDAGNDAWLIFGHYLQDRVHEWIVLGGLRDHCALAPHPGCTGVAVRVEQFVSVAMPVCQSIATAIDTDDESEV